MIKRSNGIQDAGVPLVVDPFTRKVTVPVSERVIGVVGDHCSEQVTFSLPREIDNHDMTTCTRSYIAWRNVDGEPGDDELDISETEGDRILAKWVVRDAVTVAKGLVSFSLHFECWEGEKLIYKWGTHTCSECEILDSVNARLGAYAAIYIDGETLVFADYTPVHDGKLDLSSCVLPTDTVPINADGIHDVGKYAYAKVAVAHEEPHIELVGLGWVEATADGRTGRKLLDPPIINTTYNEITAEASGLTTKKTLTDERIIKLVRVKIKPDGIGGFARYTVVGSDGKLASEKLDLLTVNDFVELNVPVGSLMGFSTEDNEAATGVHAIGHLDASAGTAMVSSVRMALIRVPELGPLDDGAIEIRMQ